MSVDRRLEAAFRDVWEAAFGPDGPQQRRSVESVINPDHTVNPDALTPSLPWSRADVMLPGAVVVDANSVRLAFPQGGHVRHVALSARVAPSGGQFFLRLTAPGGQEETFSMQPGSSTEMANANITLAPSSWLTGEVVEASGAEDITITIHYTVGGA